MLQYSNVLDTYARYLWLFQSKRKYIFIRTSKHKQCTDFSLNIVLNFRMNYHMVHIFFSKKTVWSSLIFFQFIDVTSISSAILIERIDEVKTKLHTTVNQYHNNLKKLENNRSEKVKVLFKECYEKLCKVSYVSAFELDRMFEENILVRNGFIPWNYFSVIIFLGSQQIYIE